MFAGDGDRNIQNITSHALQTYMSSVVVIVWQRGCRNTKGTLLAKKVVTPRDDVSFCDYFYFISPRGLSKDRLFGVI